MALDRKRFSYGYDHILRDSRSLWTRIADFFEETDNALMTLGCTAIIILFLPQALYILDIIFGVVVFYYFWLMSRDIEMPYCLPATAKKYKDLKNSGGGRSGKAEGIMYMGNKKDSNEEVWFTNSDARTHILYLGTTGAGKTVGLRGMVTNALCWSSGFVYIDGKADTDLWSNLSALVRRFGRDDDLFVLNYMTGNSDEKAPSNTMNPFSSGSASYLTNMLVSLMPEAEGDNAMWKERAVSLIGTIMPALTWKRDHQDVPLSISSIRKTLELRNVIALSREEALPPHLKESLKGYLNTLPGYNDAAFNDDGSEKPPGPDTPMVDVNVISQQHGYLTMQFTRSLQSLGDDYGYIFDAMAADVDMVDIVLNRRILIVLIPALEKSSDETANLGKIVAASLKGMMGSTLGSSLEGASSSIIENKPTHSATPFMTVFDEVGYYTTQGMAVMAAQARSLGFCLVYAAQDLPALEKRVKEEARSITGNCNIKIFGKLEDPTQTKEFFEKTVGDSVVTEVSSFSTDAGSVTGGYNDALSAGIQVRPNASYDGLKGYKEGQTVLCFGEDTEDVIMYFSDPGHAAAMRVQRLLSLDPPSEEMLKKVASLAKVRDKMVSKTWTAANADDAIDVEPELEAAVAGFEISQEKELTPAEASCMAIAHSYIKTNDIDPSEIEIKKTPSKPESVKSAEKEKAPASVGGSSADSTQKAPDWKALARAGQEVEAEDEKDQEEDEDGEGRQSSSGGDARQMKQLPAEEYNSEDAVEHYAETGEYQFPEGLSDEVQNILMDAADHLKSGLFGDPSIEKAPDPTGGLPSEKATKPKSPDGK